MKQLKHKRFGFTLIELLVVVGILAVITAVAIPLVSGLISKAGKTTDLSNAESMSKAVSQFAQEFEIIKTDLNSNNPKEDSVYSRVENTAKEMGYIGNIRNANGFYAFASRFIDSNTGCPRGATDVDIGKRVIAICTVYMKTNTDIFTPNQSDCSFWYLKGNSLIMCAKTNMSKIELTEYAKTLYSSTVTIDDTSSWIDLTYSVTASGTSDIVISQTGSGEVTGSGDKNNWENNTLTATPENGQTFIGWFDDNGNIVSEEEKIDYKVTEDTNITAKFTVANRNITFVTKGGGQITGNSSFSGSASYPEGTTFELNAIPERYYSFDGWYINDEKVSSDTTYTYLVKKQDQTIIAKFSLKKYSVTLSIIPESSGFAYGSGEYCIGESVTIGMTLNNGYLFSGWKEIMNGSTTFHSTLSYSFVITSDVTFEAHTNKQFYQVSISTNNPVYGSVSPTSNNGFYDDTVTITAAPLTGYHFVKWINYSTSETLSLNQTYTFKIKDSIMITGVFEPDLHKIILSSSHGVVSGGGEFSYGTKRTITAENNVPVTGYEFVSWNYTENGNLYSNDAVTSVVIGTSDIKLTATYRYVGISLTTSSPNLIDNGDGSFTYNDYKFILLPNNEEFQLVVINKDKTTYPEIPNSINGKKITSLEDSFNGCSNLTTAPKIPSEVKNINYAFYECRNLKTAPEIPNTVVDMYGAFAYCSSLTSTPILPKNVVNIREAFADCTNITTASAIPNSVENMYATFVNCSSLTTPPDMSNATNVNILIETFENCTSLATAPVIPNGITDMSGTFCNCTNLTTAPEIPNSVENMYYTFEGCTSLMASPVIPSSVTNMSWTFDDCTSLKTAQTIPNGVTDMQNTFYGCKSLISAPIISNSVTKMKYTFYGCTSLTSAPVIPNTVKDMTGTFSSCSSLTTPPAIPSGVTNMDSTFNYCTSLTKAPVLPDTVTSIKYTFCDCINLTTAPAIPSGVKNLFCTFFNCQKLTAAPEIPSGVTNIYSTFYCCKALTTAPVIPNTVTNMNGAFQCCTNLKAAPIIPYGVTDMSGTFISCKSITTAPEIPNSVREMSEAFWDCTSLVTVPTIPNSVTNMSGTFWDCTSLVTAPTIPNSVTDISQTFMGCTSLKGNVIINANPSKYTDCFSGCAKDAEHKIIIKGSASTETKNVLRATAFGGGANVTVQ